MIWFSMIRQKVKYSIQLKYKIVSKTLTLYWKPELEVNVINYGFISAFLSAGLHEEYWENLK